MTRIKFCSALAACFVLCAMLSGCGQVEFKNGSIEKKATDINLVLEAGETEHLNDLKELKSADFSGSRNYDEIRDWAGAHPEVDVCYTVALPDGQVLPYDAASIDLSGLTSENAAAVTEMLTKLPMLSAVELGSVGGRLSLDEVNAVIDAVPNAKVSAWLELLGKEYAVETAKLDLSRAKHSDADAIAAALPWFEKLESVELGSESSNDFSFDDIAAFEDAAPEAHFSYEFTMYGKPFTLDTKKINLSHVKIEDQGETVRSALRCMRSCDYLDMDFCGVDNEHMEVIRDEFPDVEVIWRVWFGLRYSARTNVEYIVASDSFDDGQLTDENAAGLKYFTKIKYLDLGHNRKLTHLNFCAYMPELEVLITCDDPVLKDISALANCPKLDYIELISAIELKDLSPLSELHNLKHINICNCWSIKDISPLYGLSQLERLWIGCRTEHIPPAQILEMQKNAPGCVINTTVWDPTDDPKDCGWRYTVVGGPRGNEYHPRYALLRQQFEYSKDPYCYSFSMYDPLYYEPAPTPED